MMAPNSVRQMNPTSRPARAGACLRLGPSSERSVRWRSRSSRPACPDAEQLGQKWTPLRGCGVWVGAQGVFFFWGEGILFGGGGAGGGKLADPRSVTNSGPSRRPTRPSRPALAVQAARPRIQALRENSKLRDDLDETRHTISWPRRPTVGTHRWASRAKAVAKMCRRETGDRDVSPRKVLPQRLVRSKMRYVAERRTAPRSRRPPLVVGSHDVLGGSADWRRPGTVGTATLSTQLRICD